MNFNHSNLHIFFVRILVCISSFSSHSLFASEAVLAQPNLVQATVQAVDYHAEGKKMACTVIDQFIAISEAAFKGQDMQNFGAALTEFAEKMKIQKNLAADLLCDINHNETALLSYQLFFQAALEEINSFATSNTLKEYKEHDSYALMEGLKKIFVINMTIHYTSQLQLGSILRDTLTQK